MIQRINFILEFYVTIVGHFFLERNGIYFLNDYKDNYFEINNKEKFEVYFNIKNITFKKIKQ